MPTNGYLEIHSDSGTIYDDGGPTGNYSGNTKSVVTIYPATPGAQICLQGTYDLEDWIFSRIKIYDGDTNSTSEIKCWGNGCYWSGSINVVSYSGAITIRFSTDTETPLTGFEINFNAIMPKVTNINYSLSNNNTSATITWDGITSDYWIVLINDYYGNTDTVTTTTNSITIDSLACSCCYYTYKIYTPEDSAYLSCYSYNRFHIPSSFYISNLQYTIACDTLTIEWTESNSDLEYRIYYNDVGNLLPPPLYNTTWYDYQTIYSDTNFVKIHIPKNDTVDAYEYWSRFSISARQDSLGNYCSIWGNQISSVCCCPKPNNLLISQIESNSATITWDSDTNATGWIVEYRKKSEPRENSLFDTVYTNTVMLNNLYPTTLYEVRVHSLCDSLSYKCSSKIDVITTVTGLDNCMTFTNLKDTNFSPKYGNYSNPNLTHGLVDYGYLDERSRHTVHYDTSEYDPRTDSLLRTIPYGEEASVRLGNWLPGAQGESFTYAYDVDTNIFDLMYLRYAVVMENPGHTPTNQPRFTLEILNANDSLIDDVCGYADFYASSSLGWNSVPGTVTIWKDWTLVGFDISPYHGQRIYVRLTTRDCDEGGHFGYAYYHLKCGSKQLISDKCGLVDSNTFTAPIGFNYRWYSSANPSITLSTERKLDAIVDSSVNYHCLVSSTENPSCTFLYTAYGGYRYPLSQLDYSYTWQPCSYTINFTNLSTISPDGINPAGTGESCETAKWIFPDGDTITTLNAVKTFSDTSEIKVRLISGIANDQCIDILDTIIKLERPYPPLNILGDSVVCKNDTATLYANHGGNYFWSNQDTTTSISFIPLIDTIYSLELIDSLGCYNIDSINIIVNPRDTIYISAEICDNETYTDNGFNTNIAGTNELKLVSQYNCDSIIYLNLTLNPTYNDTIYAEICDNETYTLYGFDENTTGLYSLNLQTIKGCDSIVNLSLIVHPTYNDTIFAEICKDELYSQFGFNERETGFYTQNLQTINGCDSIINLSLIVGEKYYDTIYAQICNGETYNLYGFNETEGGLYTQSLVSQYGCDSIVILSLIVNPTYLFDTIFDTTCANVQYTEYGLNEDSTGVYTARLKTINGCDSIYIVSLQVNPISIDTIKADIYKGNVYNLFGFRETETGLYEQKLQTYLGCDSIIYLDLQVDNIMFPNVVTPNGDGINDVFDIHNLIEQVAFPENELIIYSRQGKLIYQIKNISKEADLWDPNKTSSPEGTYFYRFRGKRSDKVIEYVGSVEVLR